VEREVPEYRDFRRKSLRLQTKSHLGKRHAYFLRYTHCYQRYGREGCTEAQTCVRPVTNLYLARGVVLDGLALVRFRGEIIGFVTLLSVAPPDEIALRASAGRHSHR
jgi:hypothetical protein